MARTLIVIGGARDWPYQAADVSLASDAAAALRLPGFDPALDEGLRQTKANCLTCHRVIGWGGHKVPGEFALPARQKQKPEFLRGTLDPSGVDPKTTMLALLTSAPEAARRAAAEAIYASLTGVPVADRRRASSPAPPV